MLKRAIALTAVSAALGLVQAVSADVGDSAAGLAARAEKFEITFTATGDEDNSGNGTMEFTDFDDRAIAGTASVRCLIVEGIDAVIVGTVITSNHPDLEIGSDLLFTVTDNATPGAGSDLIDHFFVGFNSCDSYASYLGSAIELVFTGEITVVEGITAADQLADLIAELQNDPDVPGNNFLATLQAAAGSLAAGNTQAACNQLDAFENQVKAQTGKKLTQDEAASLLTAVAAIKTGLGCP